MHLNPVIFHLETLILWKIFLLNKLQYMTVGLLKRCVWDARPICTIPERFLYSKTLTSHLQKTESPKCQEMRSAVNVLHSEAPSRYNDRVSMCGHCMHNKLHWAAFQAHLQSGHHLQRYVGTSNFMEKFDHLIKSELVSFAQGTKTSK